MQVEDGTGKGFKAEVTEENRVKTDAVAQNLAQHTNRYEGETYAVPISITPTGAGDCFAYIKNNSDTDMVLNSLLLATTTTIETIQLKIGDIGTPAGTTAVTPVNLNGGSGNEADVDCYKGVDITALSGGSVVAGIVVAPDESSFIFTPPPGIIIPKNKTLTFYAVTGAIAISMGALIVFHSE